LLGGGDTVSVTVLVLVLVLTEVLGSVVVVSVAWVVSALVDGGVVSVTVWVGATWGADVVDVVEVVVVVSVLPDESSDNRLTDNHTMSATRSAISAPKPMRAAGLRYQGVGGSGGGSPGCWP
jgi:hypothetical protein